MKVIHSLIEWESGHYLTDLPSIYMVGVFTRPLTTPIVNISPKREVSDLVELSLDKSYEIYHLDGQSLKYVENQ
jgi:hypothetical protein